MKTQLMTSAALLSLLALSGCQRAETPEVASNNTDPAPSENVQAPADTAGTTDTDRTLGETVDDAAMTGRIKTALATDPTTKARQINVTTYSGTVELSGFVDSSAEKQRAEELAHQVKGVKEVRNDLKIGQNP